MEYSSNKVKLLHLWSQDPVLGVQQLFNVEPTDQQKELIRSAFRERARTAVSSCQGAGKTSTLTWIMYLMLLTMKDCRILITSPSYQQLTRVFHSEAAKWRDKMLPDFRDDFVVTKEKVALRGKEDFQMANLVTASAENKENLQGGHSENYIVLADEGSGIHEDVFDLLLGTLGTGEGGRFVITSNPLRSSGRFYEIFSRELAKWDRLYFSGLDSPNINAEWVEEMKETYGEDHDIYRVRVLGQFPRSTSSQFIPSDVVEFAMATELNIGDYQHFPKIVGADIARFGDDSTVFTLRQGPKLLDIATYKGLDTMQVAGVLKEYYLQHKPSAINIDAIGIGAGVYDRLVADRVPGVQAIVVSNKSTEPMMYLNLRSQIWGMMKEWLINGADIPRDRELQEQLVSMIYGYNNKMQIQLMAKKDIKRQGLPSPDIGDSLSLTFAGSVFDRGLRRTTPRQVRKRDYAWA